MAESNSKENSKLWVSDPGLLTTGDRGYQQLQGGFASNFTLATANKRH